ncbi:MULTISPECIES: FKBP-type peptidyl-prolyl cis-trans isomerase [unclassified Pseudomonas]|uniref:FKBP-type peptidyl-prolyl cis-trans isomerase n=1 Tax=unclassified Pseudomonas TaxID=196821 RepID=UPI000BD53C8F|nr:MULTISPECIES: FKBP-type peptidyl-prolyl cis-trans isomerase [unclassified Pseudomonas]PVZ20786.1 FKBP-type peptidyl-prolyl cis-trans isomerase FklB [Pseudomonas sp. URIL14HWK12:I12]PVZ27852.1 FKBP-type peptidyl-prolyl cis-trans isomerase FklB [Pseudomonas sp. URIL14HWK12:I10]PVZ38741.1 FKBP-type peptidyl-prolyl cis-trans isomerase FklB [Pseudomonas sp. URIL14HWK12:I11]SNZ02200.1 FKBP-type peptidyl-prolyl cis-trans isomerase FklB [Pseudomonas sp. URIL14HWK12:I9]
MKQHRLAAAIALVGLVLAGCDKQTSSVELKTPAQKASYGIGLNMGKSLAQEGMDDLDSKAVALGIEDAVGKKEQKLKDDELVQAFADLQKRAEERMAKKSEQALADGKKFLEENGKKDGVTTTASGLQYQVIKQGDGPQPKPTDVVTVHYTGKLTDGTTFDSSVDRGSPIDLPVSGVIPGWVEGLQLMHVGEKIKLFIPSDLAYGAQSPSPAIPANSVLVFDLELLGIKDPAQAGASAADEGEDEDAAAAQEQESQPAEKPAAKPAKK